MELSHPLRLAALAAGIVPLVLHLWRRQKGTVVRVGSIRHLAGSAAARNFSIRVSEPWLLLLRLVVIAVMALAIAEPRIALRVSPRSVAILDPEVGTAVSSSALDDSLAAAGDEILRPVAGDPWSLAGEVDASLPPGSRLVLVTHPRARLIGQRPSLASLPAVRLVAIPQSAPSSESTDRKRHRFDIIAAPSQEELTRHLSAAIRAVGELRGDSVEINSAERAVQNGGDGELVAIIRPDSQRFDSASTASLPPGTWAVHFADGPTGPLERLVGSVPGSAIRLLGRDVGSVTIVRVTGAGDPAVLALSGMLPSLVAEVWNARDPAGQRVEQHSEQQILPRRVQGNGSGEPGRPVRWLFVALAAFLFMAERLVSHRRRPA